MKSTPAVFLTSLAVSAISMTMPLPAANTVLNLFIGEDLTAQHISRATGEDCQHGTHQVNDAEKVAVSPGTGNSKPKKVTFTGAAPLSDNAGGASRLMPTGFVKYITGRVDQMKRPTLELMPLRTLARSAHYINRSEGVYKLFSNQWLQGSLPLLAYSGKMLEEVY